MNSILEKVKNTRILAIIGIGSMILGTIFSYVSYTFFGYTHSIALWDYWEGKVILLLAIANLLFIFQDFVEKYVPSLFNTNLGKKIAEIQNPKASLVPTILAAVFAIYLHVKLDIGMEDYSLGFYLLWIGVIALVAYAFLHKNQDNEIEKNV